MSLTSQLNIILDVDLVGLGIIDLPKFQGFPAKYTIPAVLFFISTSDNLDNRLSKSGRDGSIDLLMLTIPN